MTHVVLGDVDSCSIIQIGEKTYKVTDIEAGIGRTQLSQVVQLKPGGDWVDAVKFMRDDPTDLGIYPDSTLVTVLK